MFTGIIEEIGAIRSLRLQGQGGRIAIACRKVLENLRPGDSVCVSGVCLTATEIERDGFAADVSAETLRRTYFGTLGAGAMVNLERSVQPQGRLGGHIVNGHVDDVGRVLALPSGGRVGDWIFSLPKALERYMVEKGSIAVDGVSLTIAGLSPGRFSVAIIPATVAATNLKDKRVGDPVNLEVDILAKYVEKLLSAGQYPAAGGRLAETLEKYGYLAE